MSVQKIEEYKQKNGIDILKVYCKPTNAFPTGGYFYTDVEIKDIVNTYSWHLYRSRRNIYVVARLDSSYGSARGTVLNLHREMAYRYLNYYPRYIDHISGVEIDNTDVNLNAVTQRQNCFNKPVRGFLVITHNCFLPKIHLDGKQVHPYSCVHTESEACILQNELETDYLKDILQDQYYMYDFLKDRRNDLDIVDQERTGVVSEEEATYRHVIRYAKNNAWYYYRYNLEQYFRDNHIPVPDFDEDEQGFMIDKITRKKLCPF